ncbi:MAG: hypothetical protein MHM6MM_006700, partial [Cercozoa sp. M6MM]
KQALQKEAAARDAAAQRQRERDAAARRQQQQRLTQLERDNTKLQGKLAQVKKMFGIAD